MARGRKRKYNPTIPAHIDQTKLPPGIYWDKSGSGRWYVLEPHPEGGRRRARTVATAAARLSELHAIMEQLSGRDARGTIGYLISQFEDSTEFAELSVNTQQAYRQCAKAVRTFRTKLGCTLDALQVDRLGKPVIQAVVETIAKGRPESRPGAGDAVPPYPSKANQILRYLRRLFAWGERFGHCTTNPAVGVRAAKERRQVRMPEHDAYFAVLQFARERGARKPRSEGSLPPYLWPIMEIAYLCRMRGIEAVRLTDAHATRDGLRVRRVKGSRDNIVRWTPRLRAAWDAAIAVRAMILARPSNRGRPIPIRPEDRYVFVNQSGGPLAKATLDTAFQSLMHAAIKSRVITEAQRFSLHGLKHRGITDTPGDKKRASGHKTDSSLNVYDHEIPTVDPAAAPDFSGEF